MQLQSLWEIAMSLFMMTEGLKTVMIGRNTWLCNISTYNITYFNTCIVHLVLFSTMINKSTINWQIIRFLLHVSTLLVFPCLFLSYKANVGVKLAKTGHGPHSSKLVVICVVLLLFVLFYVLFVFVLFYVLFVCKCVRYYCHRVLTQMQLTNISYHIIYHIISSGSS